MKKTKKFCTRLPWVVAVYGCTLIWFFLMGIIALFYGEKNLPLYMILLLFPTFIGILVGYLSSSRKISFDRKGLHLYQFRRKILDMKWDEMDVGILEGARYYDYVFESKERPSLGEIKVNMLKEIDLQLEQYAPQKIKEHIQVVKNNYHIRKE